jgi:hypothetical protein
VIPQASRPRPKPYVLAIVGSTHFENPSWLRQADAIIRAEIRSSHPDKIISGGAKGIDLLAKAIAEELGIEFEEFKPKQRRWEPNGFKERNILIAEACSRLVRIACPKSTTYGSGWTRDRAAMLGKETKEILL